MDEYIFPLFFPALFSIMYLCTIEILELNQEYTYLDAYLLYFLINFTYGAVTRIFTMNFPFFSSVAIHSSCLLFTYVTYYVPGQFPKSVICIFLLFVGLFWWAGKSPIHNVMLPKCSNLVLIHKDVISTHICSFSFLELH